MVDSVEMMKPAFIFVYWPYGREARFLYCMKQPKEKRACCLALCPRKRQPDICSALLLWVVSCGLFRFVFCCCRWLGLASPFLIFLDYGILVLGKALVRF